MVEILLVVAALVATAVAAGKLAGRLSRRLADHVQRLLADLESREGRSGGLTGLLTAATGLLLGPLRSLTAARCPVCGSPCEEPELFCDRCGTPHHIDCFQYNSHCGIYGCGGGPGRRPPAALPAAADGGGDLPRAGTDRDRSAPS